MGLESIQWHTLHSGFLDANSHVIDIGANYGNFSREIVDRFGCHCIAIEANSEICYQIESSPLIEKFHFAVATYNGEIEFHQSNQHDASSFMHKPVSYASTVVIPAKRLDDFVTGLGWDHVDLIKCDIEGAEIIVLDSLPDAFFMLVGQISIEFHDFNGMLPGSEVRRVLKRLRKLGFWDVRMSRVGHQETWLINRRRCPISIFSLLWVQWVTRNWAGFKRVLQRFFQRQFKHS